MTTAYLVTQAMQLQDPLDPDQVAQKGEWSANSLNDLEWAFEQAGASQGELEAIDAMLRDLIARATARADEIRKPALNRKAFFEGRIAEYALAHKEELLIGKKKSRTFLAGTVAWRKRAGKLIVEDEAALLAWLPDQDPRFYRIETRPNMKELKDQVEKDGIIPPGTTWLEGTDELSVDVVPLPTLPAAPAQKELP